MSEHVDCAPRIRCSSGLEKVGMLDLGRLVYLDTQKTASTFLIDFFSIYSGLPVAFFRKHSPLNQDVLKRPQFSLLVSIRRPGPYYESVFRYGLDGKGEIFKAFQREGREGLYQPSVENFMEFLAAVNEGRNWGLLTRRLLKITTCHSPGEFFNSEGDARQHVAVKNFLRAEHLSEDFRRREAEWLGFRRLSRIVSDQKAMLRHTRASLLRTRLTGLPPVWKHAPKKNKSRGEGFRVGQEMLSWLDSDEGPLAHLEKPVFDLYGQLAASTGTKNEPS